MLFQLQVDAAMTTSSPARKCSPAATRLSDPVDAEGRSADAGRAERREDRPAGDGGRQLPLEDRTVRSTVHGTVEIKLDTTRIRRRLDSKLDSIMGMVPAGLR